MTSFTPPQGQLVLYVFAVDTHRASAERRAGKTVKKEGRRWGIAAARAASDAPMRRCKTPSFRGKWRESTST
jgi:hypothetical protein